MFRTALVLLLVCSPLLCQDIVVNKFKNGGVAQTGDGDTVELLVVRDRLDLRGYILRDFATTTTNTLITDAITAGSGSFQFSDRPEWQAVRAGTLIVLPFDNSSFVNQADTVITVGLQSLLFQQTGNFNIAVRDMVMLKRPGAHVSGTEGSIHAFSAGLTQANVVGISPLLRTSDETGSANPFALPDNLGGNLADYNGNRAGTASNAVFGRANNPAHQRFLDSLRRTRTTSVRTSSVQSLVISPLPASTECLVRFRLDAAGSVSIVVTDVGGRQKELYRAVLAAGEQTVRVRLNGLAGGAYFLTVKITGGEVSGRLIVR